MGKLTNKVVLITGGTTGIGLAAAKLFAAEGAQVTVTGSNPKTLEAARQELSGVAEVVASDAGSSSDIAALAKTFEARGAGVDVLFLNAGVAKFGPIVGLDESAFDETFRVNVRGPWLTIKHFAPLLRRGGSIVFNSSINNQLGMAGSSVYAASKAAVRSLVRVAAAELAEAGVRVNAVSPGPIETPLYGKLGMSAEVVQGFARGLIAQIPLKRFGTSEEVAKAALFLASDDSSFMTGEEIVLDGGMTRV
ncbi:MAG TPA: SDR family oxidoreductase [Polyangiaceae bacterium]|jgi:NAD(P)-dependent dehydrogenase (short-subunit alcohol dehydrogenase family)